MDEMEDGFDGCSEEGRPEEPAGGNHERRRDVVILIDADAAPRDVVATADRLAKLHGARVVTVSTVNHHFDRPEHIFVDPHPQAVDMEIVGMVNGNSIFVVITQDYGLAALVLGKGAHALSPSGKVYTDDNIDLLLFERDLHARQRRAGGRTRGPSPRTKEDTLRFEQSLDGVLRDLTDRPSDP